ncbi:MAG: hypothetical protein R8L58_00835 [Mariprofundaceae bacterium]
MEFAMKVREQYLDAIGQAHGEAYKAGTTVDHRGATHFVVKLPDWEQPQLVTIGHLEIMTHELLEQAGHKLAA